MYCLSISIYIHLFCWCHGYLVIEEKNCLQLSHYDQEILPNDNLSWLEHKIFATINKIKFRLNKFLLQTTRSSNYFDISGVEEGESLKQHTHDWTKTAITMPLLGGRLLDRLCVKEETSLMDDILASYISCCTQYHNWPPRANWKYLLLVQSRRFKPKTPYLKWKYSYRLS